MESFRHCEGVLLEVKRANFLTLLLTFATGEQGDEKHKCRDGGNSR